MRLDAASTDSPSVQDAAALLAAIKPAAQAAPMHERLTEIVCHPSTLERKARLQGERGQVRLRDDARRGEIGNLVADRFGQARQLLDDYNASHIYGRWRRLRLAKQDPVPRPLGA